MKKALKTVVVLGNALDTKLFLGTDLEVLTPDCVLRSYRISNHFENL